MDVRVGLCGFTMAMEDYALHFPVVEVQHTFYEPPREEVMQRWLRATPPSLEYTMKVWQLVTHAANSPTYRRLRGPLPPGAEPGWFAIQKRSRRDGAVRSGARACSGRPRCCFSVPPASCRARRTLRA